MSTINLAEQIVADEEKARNIKKGIITALEAPASKLVELHDTLKGMVEIQEQQLEKLEYLESINKPHDRHPYHSGVVNIATSTAVGTYPKLENVITDLGYPARELSLFNFGPGNIFFVFSKDGVSFSGNETKLESKMGYNATTDDRYEIYYIHIRTDTNSTAYEIVGG